jgi:hypothetical protein
MQQVIDVGFITLGYHHCTRYAFRNRYGMIFLDIVAQSVEEEEAVEGDRIMVLK